jgi:hypothetical protein
MKTKTVALVNGIMRMRKYNAILSDHYAKMGYQVVEYKFPTGLLFCCHLHGQLEGQVKEIVEGADVVHCQSSGFFPVLPFMVKHSVRKPLIMESPVLASHTGTLYAATNKIKHYSDVKQNPVINWALDTFAFTPSWTKQTLSTLSKAKSAGDALVLHSDEDNVSDCRGLEEYLTHIWPKGKHARLFHPDTGNDFKVVKSFIEDYKA